MNIRINHAPVAGLIARPVDLQSSMLPLCCLKVRREKTYRQDESDTPGTDMKFTVTAVTDQLLHAVRTVRLDPNTVVCNMQLVSIVSSHITLSWA